MIRRILLGVLLLFVLLVLALAWVIFTPSGARWTVDQVQSRVDGLDTQVKSGTFWSGLELVDTHWSMPGLTVSLDRLVTRWRFGCLMDSVICIDRVATEALDVRIDPARMASGESQPEPSPDSGTGRLDLPVAVKLNELRLEDTRVAVTNGPTVELPRFVTGASLEGADLTLDTTEVHGLNVSLPAGESEAAGTGDGAGKPAEPAPSEAASGSERLALPLDIHLTTLRVEDTRVEVADGPRVSLPRLTTGIALERDRLRIAATELTGLRVHIPAGKAETAQESTPAVAAAEGGPLKVALPDVALPLDVSLERLTVADAALVQGDQTRRLDRLVAVASVEGDTARLEQLDASAPEGSASLNGRVTMLDQWPLDLSLRVSAADLMEAGEQRVSAQLSGSVADLKATVDATGAVAAHVQATARVLTPDIPWTLQLSSPGVQWPLTGDPQVHVSDLRLRGEGDVGQYRITLDTGVRGPQIPPGQWHLAATGDPRSARVETLTGELLGGRLALNGTVAWAPDPSWDITLDAENLQPGKWRENLDGTVGGEVAVSGGVKDGGWALNADIHGIDGQWQGHPLSLKGSVSHSVADVWTVDNVVASTGENRIRAAGRISDTWDLDATLDLPRLAGLWPGLAGAVNGDVAVSGALAKPSVRGNIDGDGMAFQDLSLRALSLDMDVAQLAERDSSVRLNVQGIEQADQSLGTVNLAFDGTRAQHTLAVEAHGLPQDIAAELAVSGGLDDAQQRWTGALTRGRIALPEGEWRLADQASLALGLSPQSVELGPHCWRREPASLCVSEPATYGPDGAHLVAALREFDLRDVKPYLPPDVAVDATVDADVAANWQSGQHPTATARVETVDGSVSMRSDQTEEPFTLDFQRIALNFDLDPDQASVRLALRSQRLGAGDAVVNVDPFSETRNIDGTIKLGGIELAPLQPFVPALTELEGNISADGKLAGRLQKPEFRGQVKLADARVAIRGASVPIEDIGLRANIDGSTAELDGELTAGAGTAHIGGSVDWSRAVTASVALVGDGLEVGFPPIVRSLTLSPALVVNVRPEEISVNGRLSIPSGRFVLEELPAGSVSVSDDAVVVNQPRQEKAAGTTLKSNIYLILGDDVSFEGLGAEGRLTGSLQLQQIGTGGAEANGEIRLLDGRYQAYGQDLTIRRGQFLFAGPISEPRLDIEAIRQVDTVVAGIRVTGSASQPEVTLFSEPPMAQADVLTYLLTGSAPGGASPSEQELVAQAALSLGLLGGEGVGSAVADKLGVENFKMGASGKGDDTQVAVSGNISPNLIVSYGVGVFQPENTLTLRYYLTQQLYLEAVSGLDSALDVFYSFDF